MALKMKYMINHEEWALNQQVILASNDELKNVLNFRDYSNVTIALQFN